MVNPTDPVSKLRWRCRRGMRELDALMLGWLDKYYEQADDELRQRFLEMLDMQDPELMDIFWDYLHSGARTAQSHVDNLHIDDVRVDDASDSNCDSSVTSAVENSQPGCSFGGKSHRLSNTALDIKAKDARYDEIVTQICKAQVSH